MTRRKITSGAKRAKPRRKPAGKPASRPLRRPRVKPHAELTRLPAPRPNVEDAPRPGLAGSAAGGNPLLKAAGRFHGHIGPFLALGMRMGLLANEAIGRDPFGVISEVTVEIRAPRGCLIDGIQYTTGCTMGKGNIRVTEDPVAIGARFERGSRVITVTARQDVVARMEGDLEGMSEKAIIDYAFKIMDTPAVDLFEVT